MRILDFSLLLFDSLLFFTSPSQQPPLLRTFQPFPPKNKIIMIGLLQSLLLIILNRHNLIGALLAIETILILTYSIAVRQGSTSNMTEATGLVILAVSISAIEAAIGLAISAVYRNLRANLNLSLQTLLIAKSS